MGRPRAYEGTEPYVFVSYSHRDETRVWPMIEGLQSRGVRVWYDGGIEAGSHWDDEIFRHLDGSSHILAFVTENFLGSENCMDEIHFAKENQKGPMLLYLDRLELPKKLQYRYGRLQALIEPQFDSTDDFLDALSQTKIIADCKDQESSPKSPQAKAESADIDYQLSEEELFRYFIGGTRYAKTDPVRAVKYYQVAAAGGYAPAQNNLGGHYMRGEGVAQDHAEAATWFRRAAEQGHALAQHNLGQCYLRGEGTPQDASEAVKWFCKAAEQGDAGAQNRLGDCYWTGCGVPKNHAEAVKWYRKAAAQGNSDAQLGLTKLGLSW